MRKYDTTYKAIRNCYTSAHVAFASVSYIADDKFSNTDESDVINPLVCEFNIYPQNQYYKAE